MGTVCTEGRCKDCGYEWTVSLFSYITPETVREELELTIEEIENGCPNCGSKNIIVGGTAFWD